MLHTEPLNIIDQYLVDKRSFAESLIFDDSAIDDQYLFFFSSFTPFVYRYKFVGSISALAYRL